MHENNAFLKEQIITYIGNKRSLLDFIAKGIKIAKDELNKDKLSSCDLFSGSGVVARFLKQHSKFLVANDLELYSKITNECYLTNADDELKNELLKWHKILNQKIANEPKQGFIAELYAPKNDEAIRADERVFYTQENAVFLDTARAYIDDLPSNLRKFFIAPLLYEASTKANTSGVFKGFYKDKNGVGRFGGDAQNALKRIRAKMALNLPIFSNFNCDFCVFDMDANALAAALPTLDLVYLDPPYNQHPYGSNYFMLNLIAKNERPEQISKISGIAKGWNRSVYNNKSKSNRAFFELIASLRARFVLISFNSEGFISRENFENELSKMGKVTILEQKYNTFRASRNLNNRNIHVSEFLYVLKKHC
ncbi:DNA adenine methylase [Campylobacter gastrosuis]|uniref:site-specific DNA-methyltransferase (adenine-specific) n=1 Tax=Campylobacter gastrosuis TaxID=2974576 RepID=A0ABT7HRC6_9BACT|nr:DNA adenine methylase [Campylobacter gastrosuis]MDL0089461.1 DNA adenine methylase [Campylobacter gastrosuis]